MAENPVVPAETVGTSSEGEVTTASDVLDRIWSGIPDEMPVSVTPDDIERQRSLGWPDFHPETYCHRCGGKNVRSWFVESDRFYAAVEALGLNVGAIVCPGCFVVGHELATSLGCTWRLVPDTHFRPIEDVER